ncbi:hypothetical protein B0T17DRAFT_501085, partial [Bombardia bombarda]
EVSLRVSTVLIEAGIPCISFFDKRRYSFASANSLPTKSAGLISLLYFLLTQLINVLPPQFETELDFDQKQFARLDGTMASITPALDMIQALLTQAPPSLVFVVDGIQAFESQDTVPHLRKLARILREQSKKTVVKVLFTTDGMSRWLGELLKGRERVDASRISQARPWGPSHGFDSLDNLSASSSSPSRG